jgi:hypothetical protein
LGYFRLLCVLIHNYSILTFKKHSRMKKLFAIIAMAALASCGGSDSAATTDTAAAVVVDTAAAAPVDSTATDSAAVAAPADSAAQAK